MMCYTLIAKTCDGGGFGLWSCYSSYVQVGRFVTDVGDCDVVEWHWLSCTVRLSNRGVIEGLRFERQSSE